MKIKVFRNNHLSWRSVSFPQWTMKHLITWNLELFLTSQHFNTKVCWPLAKAGHGWSLRKRRKTFYQTNRNASKDTKAILTSRSRPTSCRETGKQQNQNQNRLETQRTGFYNFLLTPTQKNQGLNCSCSTLTVWFSRNMWSSRATKITTVSAAAFTQQEEGC